MSKYMLFSKPKNTQLPKQNLQINNNNIQSTSELNFLDLHINTKLNWDMHVNVVSNKILRVIGMINKTTAHFPKQILLLIYNVLILPHNILLSFFMGFWQCCKYIFKAGKDNLATFYADNWEKSRIAKN